VLLVLHVRVLSVSTRNSAGPDMANPVKVRFPRDDCRTFKKLAEQRVYMYIIKVSNTNVPTDRGCAHGRLR
jgi:hypothetical protein